MSTCNRVDLVKTRIPTTYAPKSPPDTGLRTGKLMSQPTNIYIYTFKRSLACYWDEINWPMIVPVPPICCILGGASSQNLFLGVVQHLQTMMMMMVMMMMKKKKKKNLKFEPLDVYLIPRPTCANPSWESKCNTLYIITWSWMHKTKFIKTRLDSTTNRSRIWGNILSCFSLRFTTCWNILEISPKCMHVCCMYVCL